MLGRHHKFWREVVGGLRKEPAAVLLLPAFFDADGRPEGLYIDNEAKRAG